MKKTYFIYVAFFLIVLSCGVTAAFGQQPTVPKKITDPKTTKPVRNTPKSDSVTYVAVPGTVSVSAHIATADELYLGQGDFIIRTADDYRYLTLKDYEPVAGSIGVLWSFIDRAPQQQWSFERQPDGLYKIRSGSGQYLTIRRLLVPSIDPKANDDNQLWEITETSDGFYTIKSKSNKYMVVIDRQKKEGGGISFATAITNDTKQKWQLIKWSNDRRKVTSFTPATHGFRFINTFNGEDVVRWGGLCGGMIYSALDYFRNNIPVPTQSYTPANATTLQSYIFQRQQHSMWNVNEKWSELQVAYNTRGGEIFRWGIQGTGGGRLEELRNAINANRSVPIGLFGGGVPSIDNGTGGDHVVLAVGYAMGRYTGDLGKHAGDYKIFAYDPNMGNRMVTLVPDLAKQCFFEVESGKVWRTYFVNTRYDNEHTPPRNIPNFPEGEADGSIKHLYVTFATGGDDLRGGNDNVSITVEYTDGTQQSFGNVNNGARWIDNSWQTVHLELNRPVRKADIRYFRFRTSFGSDSFSDDWNLDWVKITTGRGGMVIAESYPTAPHKYICRFSGDERRQMHSIVVR